jgi:hypothetical protein
MKVERKSLTSHWEVLSGGLEGAVALATQYPAAGIRMELLHLVGVHDKAERTRTQLPN